MWLQNHIKAFNSAVIQIFVDSSKNVASVQKPKLPLSRVSVGGPIASQEASPVSLFARTSGVTDEHLTTLGDEWCLFLHCFSSQFLSRSLGLRCEK